MVVVLLTLGVCTSAAEAAAPIAPPGDSGTFDTDFGNDTDLGDDTDLTPDTDDTDLVDDTDFVPTTDTDTGIAFCPECQSASDLAGEEGGPPTCQVGFAIGAASQAPVLAGLLAAAVARRRRRDPTRAS